MYRKPSACGTLFRFTKKLLILGRFLGKTYEKNCVHFFNADIAFQLGRLLLGSSSAA